MPEKGRYLRAMGLESRAPTNMDFTPEGVVLWATSKVPAAAGGMFYDWVVDWAIKKWPNAKRGADFTGGVCVAVGAYGLQVLVNRFQATYSGIIDKFTDGMIGRISPVVYGLLSGLWEGDAKGGKPARRVKDIGTSVPVAAVPASVSAAATRSAVGPEKPAEGLDNDRESIRDVGALLRDSPETTRQMADQMFAIMQQGGVNIDDAGREAVVHSMRQAAANFAADNF